jgi:rare lipoprotein A
MAYEGRFASIRCKAASTARVLRGYASVCSAAVLGAAALYGCAQLETVPEPESESAQAEPARSSAARLPGMSPAPSSRPAPSKPPAQSPESGQQADEPAAATRLRGLVSMYGAEFAGRKTASGDAFDPAALTMAHATLPFGTRVRDTKLENKLSVDVVVKDRGPYVAGRIADLSEAAARRIGMIADGVVEALLVVLQQPGKDR